MDIEQLNIKQQENSQNLNEDSNQISKFKPLHYVSLFQSISANSQIQNKFISHLKLFLCSKHKNLCEVFEFCLYKKEQNYFKIILKLLAQYFDPKTSLVLEQSLQKYLIKNIWKHCLLKHRKYLKMTTKHIILYLSMKMRSLEPNIRLQALNSLFWYVVSSKERQEIVQIKKLLPQMIQKQNLDKNMTAQKGVLLQILQDEICQIKVRGIQFLGNTHQYFDINILRPLILYMLNDEYENMRQTSLKVLSKIPAFDLEQQDLKALLMCLSEKNIGLRGCVYQNLMNINVTSSEDLYVILKKLFDTLILYKIDKKKIYKLCRFLGQTYPEFVGSILNKLYHYSDSEEPNWKNIIYKAKVITLSNVGLNTFSAKLPTYFKYHYLYIRDIESAIFMGQSTQQEQCELTYNYKNIHISNRLQIQQFLTASKLITKGFTNQLLSLLIGAFNYFQNQKAMKQLRFQLIRVSISYQIENSQFAQNLLSKIQRLLYANIKTTDYNMRWTQQIKQIALEILQHQQKLSSMKQFIFRVSTYDKNCVIISKNERIIQQCYIQFETKRQRHIQSQKIAQSYFIKMREVDFQDNDQNIWFYNIKFKWRRLRCFIRYGNKSQGYRQLKMDSVLNDQ